MCSDFRECCYQSIGNTEGRAQGDTSYKRREEVQKGSAKGKPRHQDLLIWTNRELNPGPLPSLRQSLGLFLLRENHTTRPSAL